MRVRPRPPSAQPDSATTLSSDPVFAVMRPAAGVPANRLRKVPSRPASGKARASRPLGPLTSSTRSNRSHVARSARSSPDPSSCCRPSTGRPRFTMSSRMIARPDTVVPWPPKRAPSSLVSTSAVVLSLSFNISPTISCIVGDTTDATGPRSAGARPSPAGPAMCTPRAVSSSVSVAAAKVAG